MCRVKKLITNCELRITKGIPVLLMFFLLLSGGAAAGNVTGSIHLGGGPVADGTVLFFSAALGPAPDESRYMRTPEIIAQTDSQGNFKVEVPEGKYYIGALKRLSGKWGGPPREGDMFFISRNADGRPGMYEVQKEGLLDIGSIIEPAPVREAVDIGEATGVEGIIYDMNGNPFEDVVVFAYAGPISEQGLAFVSGYTQPDGKYVLRVPQGGSYQFMVMGKFGSVFPGSGMSIVDDGKEVSGSVAVSTGEMNGNVDITITIPVEK